MKAIRRFDTYLLFAALLSAFAVAPLLAPGYFWGAHDARHSVYFLVEFDRAIQDGILYPRWMPDFNFGYGYPFFNIYSPLTSYLGEALHLLGVSFVGAVKAVFGLGFVLSAVAMYVYARRVLGSRAGALIAAAVYLYVPYHLADVYLRGALADSFCFVFFPLVLLGFHNLVEKPGRANLVLAGAALAGLVFSHYPLALLFIPFVGFYVLALWAALVRKQRENAPVPTAGESLRLPQALAPLLWSIGAGLYAAALSAILLLPVAFEFRYVRTDQWAGGYYSYKDHFVYLFQFFAPTWGYGPGSVAGPHDTLPFQLGAVAVTFSILSLLAYLLLRRARRAEGLTPLVPFFLLATVTLLLLMLDVSAPPWDILRLASFAQFPWRLLALTTLTTALLSGIVLLVDERLRQGVSLPLLAAVLAVVVLGSYGYLQPEIIDPPEGPVSLAGLMRFQQSSGEMTGMTAWATLPHPPDWSPLAEVYANGGMVTDKVMRDTLAPGVQATTSRHTSVADDVRVSTPEPTVLSFYTAYYPGWRATVDGQPVPITPVGDLGAISVSVPAGEHDVSLRFGDTPPRTVGALVSLLAAIAGATMLIRGHEITAKS